ncbi:hypothetical protein BDA96_06G217500 [Sorghum bicolor]|uniref:Uncharacterized protein n=1 Tax=Sorghum bicolor TaxID=4558 RepID=A0A921QUX9_SORBI|nr:hypothetical protein BDA96_06G217500 [Sorghum bicolor]
MLDADARSLHWKRPYLDLHCNWSRRPYRRVRVDEHVRQRRAEKHAYLPHHATDKHSSHCCLEAHRYLLLRCFCGTKSLRSATCQESPCCCLETYSRPAFTVLLILRVEQLLDPIQLREYISKDAGSVVGSRGHMVEQVGARGRCEAQVQELSEATPRRGAFSVLDL